MATLNELSVGDRWAYRVGDVDVLTEVEVLGISDSKPARVDIAFVALPEPGVASVPPSRLKVRWSERRDFLEWEAQWRGISSRPDDIERTAVNAVIEEFIRPAASIGWGKRMSGTIAIYDPDLVDVFMGGGLHEVLQGAGVVSEGGVKHYGWRVAVEIAKRTCRSKSDRVMDFVEAEEANDRSERSSREGVSVKMRLLEASTRQAWDLLRDWCGRGAASSDELVHRQHENARLQALLDAAVALIANRVGEASARALFNQARPHAGESDWQQFLEKAVRLSK